MRETSRLTKAGIVEKLERVLRAEDDARDALSEARKAAQRIADEARQEAAEIRTLADESAASQADAVRATILAQAHDEGQRVAEAATAESREELVAAEVRLSGAVERAMRELVG